MSVSILSDRDRVSLGNGMSLRLLSAHELLQARREARELAKSPLEQPLCSNACLIARALEVEGEDRPLFSGAMEVLEGLTAEEIEALAMRWDAFRRSAWPGEREETEWGVNPNFDERRFMGREESQR
jgi:hypothetical protein